MSQARESEALGHESRTRIAQQRTRHVEELFDAKGADQLADESQPGSRGDAATAWARGTTGLPLEYRHRRRMKLEGRVSTAAMGFERTDRPQDSSQSR